ncbi:MAG: twin transmembrane helix small protein [Burkholderiaceae bacterium]|nr:twin transmembrane helix small protein [Burkholderiaceae bacterium]
MRIVVILALVGILGSLASALIYLMRDKGGSNRTVNALTVRIGLSIALFLFVLFAHHMGWIQSTGMVTR